LFLTDIECEKRWQQKSTSLPDGLIPDLWFYRIVKCLMVLEETPKTICLFINPEWSVDDLIHYGFASAVK